MLSLYLRSYAELSTAILEHVRAHLTSEQVTRHIPTRHQHQRRRRPPRRSSSRAKCAKEDAGLRHAGDKARGTGSAYAVRVCGPIALVCFVQMARKLLHRVGLPHAKSVLFINMAMTGTQMRR